MSTRFSSDFIRRIPKTDLHVHLDGSLRIPTLIDLAKQGGVELPSYEEAGLLEKVFKETYNNLPEYLEGFRYTVAVMQTPENLERVAYELAQDNLAEGVRYLEVRFAPQLHVHVDLSIAEVIRSVDQGLRRAKEEFNREQEEENGDEEIPFEYGIIVCALRSFNEHYSAYYKDLFNVLGFASLKTVFTTASLELARVAAAMVTEEGLPVVGFDLAGEEAGFPAGDHHEAFQLAHENFIYKTVHAGEAYGPESIFQAITDCHANRIGHGTFLFAPDHIQADGIEDPHLYVRQLAEYIANRRITIEVNLTSNLQTIPSLGGVENHPLKDMLRHNLSVTLCTDNRLHSRTTVSREIELAVNSLPITPRQLRNMVIAGFKGSFYPGSYNEKRLYVRKVINRYIKLEKEWLPNEE